MTVTVQIGNSDDKLTQGQWSDFVNDIDTAIITHRSIIHFKSGSHTELPWQNYCWVFQLPIDVRDSGALYQSIKNIRQMYNQDSAAWTEGETIFI